MHPFANSVDDNIDMNYRFYQNSNNLIVQSIISSRWLDNPNRIFPIQIDPSSNFSTKYGSEKSTENTLHLTVNMALGELHGMTKLILIHMYCLNPHISGIMLGLNLI